MTTYHLAINCRITAFVTVRPTENYIKATPHNSLQHHRGVFTHPGFVVKALKYIKDSRVLRRAMLVKSSSSCPCDLCGVALRIGIHWIKYRFRGILYG